MNGGRLVGLSDTGPYPASQFISYNGYDVLACVQDGGLIHTVIAELAALHINQKAQTAHPDEIDIVIKAEVMKDDQDNFSGWAVLIRPETMPGSNRTATKSNHQSKQQKRRAHN
ncbi:hypothetical protein PG993_008489 [Apiospora rasikravindrae]|uniref:Uncharacterized protein n=1 Tax=Apiospora rasikravindrae TaxID=990691 RepID=A0ABR1T0H9_9PEZI